MPSIIINGHEIVQSTSATGDTCHHDIMGYTKTQAKNIVKNSLPVSDVNICDEAGSAYKKLTQTDLLTLNCGNP